ncbi:MAG: phosphoglycerate kinase [bacterium]|nr:phosphoglycerate kinase [bacterium]
MSDIKSISEAGELHNRRILVRVDWNVPVEEGQIADDFRIEMSRPTLDYITNNGGEALVMSHFASDEVAQVVCNFAWAQGINLLPNLRGDKREEENSSELAKELAGQADIYVNEAFSASHRAHASIVGVPRLLPSFAGLRFKEEIWNLSKAFNPSRPFFLILGGAKFETKLPLVEKFLNIADEIFIGGTMAKQAHERYKDNSKISFPHGDIEALDIDEETLKNLKLKTSNSKLILWNGPLGRYEDEEYQEGTKELAQIIAESGKESIVGGGDTLAAIKELEIFDKFTFVSTGGGAMLDFLANGTLPGIEALTSRD